ncbi:MAG: hypothetical protein ACK4M6_06760 [Hyphomonas sp.]
MFKKPPAPELEVLFKGVGVILRKDKLIIFPQRKDKHGLWRDCGPVEKIDSSAGVLLPVTRALGCQEVVEPENSQKLLNMLGIKSWKETYKNDRHLSGVLKDLQFTLSAWVPDGVERGLVPGSFHLDLPLPLSESTLREAFNEAFASIANA